MSSQLFEIWQKTLDILKSEFTSEVGFRTWIEPIEPLSMSSTTITLCVPNEFLINILNSRYLLLIQSAIQQVTFKEYSVKFILPNEIVEKPEEKSNNYEQDNSSSFMLNPKYTFDKFVIGNNNRFAHAAALAVAESPAKAYNPLFLYGGVGLGKTHLMHAIGHYVLSQNPKTRVLYVSSEKFTNELINSIKDEPNRWPASEKRTVSPLSIMTVLPYSHGIKCFIVFAASSDVYRGRTSPFPARRFFFVSLEASVSCICALSASMIEQRFVVSAVA